MKSISLVFKSALLVSLVLAFSGWSHSFALDHTLVAGKTVYRNMGLEGVAVEAAREGIPAITTSSTYHGDFLLKLPPGDYTLTAWTPPGYSGAKENLASLPYPLKIEPGAPRVDRLVLELFPVK